MVTVFPLTVQPKLVAPDLRVRYCPPHDAIFKTHLQTDARELNELGKVIVYVDPSGAPTGVTKLKLYLATSLTFVKLT